MASKKQKGKKGAKKGKKKVVKPKPPPQEPPIPPPPPPPTTYAKIFELTFANEDRFLESLRDIDFSLTTYILFMPAEEQSCKVCPGKLSLEEALYIHLIRMQKDPSSKDIQLLLVGVAKARLKQSQLHIHPKILLNDVPSIMRWGNLRKIEGDECYDPKILSFFFEDETRRNSRIIEVTEERCPFLPALPPIPPPAPTPQTNSPKKKKQKKGKGKDKKAKKGGKKGKKK